MNNPKRLGCGDLECDSCGDSRIREAPMTDVRMNGISEEFEYDANRITHHKKDSPKTLTQLRDEAHATAVEHGFTNATFLEEIALCHSELSEALEDWRSGQIGIDEFAYLNKETGAITRSYDPTLKPIGIASELGDVIIRILDMAGKHRIDIERAVLEKMAYNKTRPFMHGGKKI